MNLALIKHDNDPRKFLFQVPDHVYLKEGDRVTCKTRRGEADGTCVYDSFTLEGPALDIFISVMGAKKPLAPIIGEYQKVMYTVKGDADTDITVKRYKMLHGVQACAAYKGKSRLPNLPGGADLGGEKAKRCVKQITSAWTGARKRACSGHTGTEAASAHRGNGAGGQSGI